MAVQQVLATFPWPAICSLTFCRCAGSWRRTTGRPAKLPEKHTTRQASAVLSVPVQLASHQACRLACLAACIVHRPAPPQPAGRCMALSCCVDHA